MPKSEPVMDALIGGDESVIRAKERSLLLKYEVQMKGEVEE
jgi:hypothetical protein